MNRNIPLDTRRLNLIRQISEIENEETLRSIESFIARRRADLEESLRNYPFAPSKEELHAIIEQVLEEDRLGLFTDGEEAEREMQLYMEEALRQENDAL